ncbi:MAG: class I SAM-dependent methyltransferase [Planctomycetota bacterium]
MYTPGNAYHYLSVGLSGIRCISTALRSTRVEWPIETILDFPCGHGRVLRFLRPMFPGADITAAEIEHSALDFCRRAFSTSILQSKKNLGELVLSQRFDLIWCGSLLTHIDEVSAKELLRFFHDHMTERGLCIFTTHGHRFIERIKNKKRTYGLSEDAQRKVADEFQRKGYGYANYPNQSDYGISAVAPERMRELAKAVGEWDETLLLECGWDDHQDVYAFTRQAPNRLPGEIEVTPQH